MALFVITGQKEVIANLERVVPLVKSGMRKTLETATVDIRDMAKSRTPVNTGALQGSGTAHEATDKGSAMEAVVSFGDDTPGTKGRANREYALIVHEIHPSQSKFLEASGNEYAPRLLAVGQDMISAEINTL